MYSVRFDTRHDLSRAIEEGCTGISTETFVIANSLDKAVKYLQKKYPQFPYLTKKWSIYEDSMCCEWYIKDAVAGGYPVVIHDSEMDKFWRVGDS